MFNTRGKAIYPQVVINNSWDTVSLSLPRIKIESNEMEKQQLNLKVPKLKSSQNISFKFLDDMGIEIPDSAHQIEFIIEGTKKEKIVRFLKGVGRIAIDVGKIIVK